MRIALFHNLPSGGAKRSVYEWIRHLAGKHTIDAYTLQSANHDFCDIRPFVRKYNIYPFSPHRLFQSPFGRLNQLQRWRDLGDLERLNRQIAAEINRGGYDVVLANPCSYTVVPLLLQYVKIPSVYYLHEPFGRSFQRSFVRPYIRQNGTKELLDRFDPMIWLYRHRLNNIQTRSLKMTTLLLANSIFTHQEMKLGFGLVAPVCHIGVDSESFHPKTGMSKENILISVGELSPRKGFDFLLESLANLPSGLRPRLILACNRIDRDEQVYIQQLADQYKIDLEILSNLDTSELCVQYNRAKLCIYAPVLEPFGLVPLEAMACGTPVVGVNEGGVKETVIDGQTGLLVERDPVKFANAIRFLFDNPDLYKDLSQQARIYATAEWSWSKLTAELEDHLISVM